MCDTHPQKGYLSVTCAIPHENKAKWERYPLCDTILKGHCAIRGGICIGPLRMSTKFSVYKIWVSRPLGKSDPNGG